MYQRYYIVGITAVAALWMYIDRVCFSTLADPVQKDLKLSPDEKELLLGAFFLTYAIFQIPMGGLADRFGARLVLALSIAERSQGSSGWSSATARPARRPTTRGPGRPRRRASSGGSGCWPGTGTCVCSGRCSSGRTSAGRSWSPCCRPT